MSDDSIFAGIPVVFLTRQWTWWIYSKPVITVFTIITPSISSIPPPPSPSSSYLRRKKIVEYTIPFINIESSPVWDTFRLFMKSHISSARYEGSKPVTIQYLNPVQCHLIYWVRLQNPGTRKTLPTPEPMLRQLTTTHRTHKSMINASPPTRTPPPSPISLPALP